MKKYVCPVCGYVYEGDELPEGFKCPICGVSGEKFQVVEGDLKLAAEHEFGIGTKLDGVPEEDKKFILDQLKANFNGECSEVGMYLCMARIAHREGYPEIGLYWEKAAYEEAEHAAKFAELLGSELEPNMTASTWSANSAQRPARSSWPRSLRRTTSMPSMTPSMKWPATRPATARLSRVCWSATSAEYFPQEERL